MRYLVLASLVLIAACGDKDKPAPVPTPTPTSKPPYTTDQLRDGIKTVENQSKEADNMMK